MKPSHHSSSWASAFCASESVLQEEICKRWWITASAESLPGVYIVTAPALRDSLPIAPTQPQFLLTRLHRKRKRGVAIHSRRELPRLRSTFKQAHVCPRHNAAGLDINGYLLSRSRHLDLCAALERLAGPEVVPGSVGQHHLAVRLSGKQRRNHHPVAKHVLIIDVAQPCLLRRIQHERAERRRPVFGVALESRRQVRHKLHPPADNLAATRLELLPAIEQLVRIILFAVQLLPRRILDIPAIHHCERREHHALQAANQIFFAHCVAHFRTPQQPAESRVHQPSNEVAMRIQVAVE